MRLDDRGDMQPGERYRGRQVRDRSRSTDRENSHKHSANKKSKTYNSVNYNDYDRTDFRQDGNDDYQGSNVDHGYQRNGKYSNRDDNLPHSRKVDLREDQYSRSKSNIASFKNDRLYDKDLREEIKNGDHNFREDQVKSYTGNREKHHDSSRNSHRFRNRL